MAVRRMLSQIMMGAALSAAVATTAAAQATSSATAPARPGSSSATRSPIWYEATLGGSGMRLTCDFCQPARDVGPSATIALGGYGSDRVRLGVELGMWTYGNEDVREHLQSAGVVAHLVPNPRRGLYLIGGFGWSGYRAGEFKYDAPRVTVGAGWDIPAGGKFVVGNVITLDAAAFATLRSDEISVLENVGLSVVRAAVKVRRK